MILGVPILKNFRVTSINFIVELLSSNFLLPTFSTGGKLDFQVPYLLLATVNV